MDHQEASKRKIASHKLLLANMSQFQEKLEELADNRLLKDEAFRQLCKDNMDMYQQMKELIDTVLEIPNVYQELIMQSDQVMRWRGLSAPQNIAVTRQQKMSHRMWTQCECGEYIHKYQLNVHRKRTCHNQNIVRLEIERNNKLKKFHLGTLLTINSHLVSLKYHSKKFKYRSKHIPWMTLKQLVRRRYIRNLGA